MSKRILVGSRAFFGGYKDFRSKDYDYLELVKNPIGFMWRREQSIRGVCTFVYKLEPVADMVQRTLDRGDALLIGKFLVPEVADAIGASVSDVLPLASLIPALDEKHKYLEVIFNAIKQNGSFTLTDKQRMDAYKVYNESRQPNSNKSSTM